MFFYHVGFMGAGFLALFIGGVVARYGKRQRWWLKVHRGLAYGGVLMALAGFAFMFIGKTDSHFRVPHAWLGAVVILLAVATPVLGNLLFILRERAAALRTLHRWSGRTTLILMGLNIISGLFVAGIL